MQLLIIGTGYVGLVTGACFAEMGHRVLCLDIDREKIALLQKGIIPFYEPGLEELVRNNVQAGRLHFTTDYAYGVKQCLVCFIAVDTPPREDGSADLSSVYRVVESIATHMDGYRVIVNKSTVPVGTTERMHVYLTHFLEKQNKRTLFSLVANPEFLQEGRAIATAMRPARVIVGVSDDRARAIMKEIYRPFMVSHERLLFMSLPSAEMAKYAANAMLACRISFMNELARLCERTEADIHQVRLGMGTDDRIGLPFLWAGVGYGGSCFPKDVVALERQAEEVGIEAPLLSAITRVNREQRYYFIRKIEEYFAERGGLSGKVLGILGLAFKPDTDDLREAPSLFVLRYLLEEGVQCRVFDPIAMQKAKKLFAPSSQFAYASSEEEAATGADALVLLTEWKQFRSLDLRRIHAVMRGVAFFDGRNQYDPIKMEQIGFTYFSVGRPAQKAIFQSLPV